MGQRYTVRGRSMPPAGLPGARRLARRMTVHIAAAIVVYAALQLWLVLGAVSGGAPRILPYVAVALLLVAVIPTARRIEARWARLSADTLPSRELSQSFRQDARRLWSAAIVLPFLWVGAFVGASAAAGVLH